MNREDKSNRLNWDSFLPSFKMAIIRTMKGEKSNFQIKAISINPSYRVKNKKSW